MVVLYTPEQVAEQLQVSVKTLANWRSAGIGPVFVKLSAAVRYEPTAIEAYVEACRPKSNVTQIRAARSA